MASQQEAQIHVLFFPLMAQGHMIPLFDVARLFASRGAKATLLTTPANAPAFSESDTVEIRTLRFPSEEAGLPAGIENISQLTGIELQGKFTEALKLISQGQELEELLLMLRPSCLVADIFLPGTAEVAARAGVPWVAFNVGGYFAMSVSDVLRRLRPQWAVESEDEEFVVPGLPGGEVRLTRRKLSPAWTTKEEETPFVKGVAAAFETEERSFGVIMNSFSELEADYAHHYRNVIGRRCWSLGPVSLSHRNIEDKAKRGKQAAIDVHECLRWLDSKPPNSVIYVCFGSVTHNSSAQLIEIAVALEALDQHFIWVVRGSIVDNKVDEDEWLPSGFEARNNGKGLIIRGWAPQVMILDHPATGGFVTHCGWNSTLEGVSAGVPLVTWPMFAEQFLNEKLVAEVLRVGVSVGAKQNYDWMVAEARVGRAEIEAAVRRVMVGEEAEEMRRRAAELKGMALKAVQPGGSSYNALTSMLETFGMRS